jgi:Domain of unknown function (DUF4124)
MRQKIDGIKYKAVLIITVLAASLATSNNVFAQYKWTDKSGSTIYSDSPPPPSVGAKNAKLTPFVKHSANKVLPLASMPTKPIEGTAASSVEAESKKSMLYDKDACDQMQGYMRILREGGKISKIDKDGRRIYLDDKASGENSRQKEIIDTQRRISELCKKV